VITGDDDVTTTTWAVLISEQSFKVYVTVYDVVTIGETRILDVVSFELHKKEPPDGLEIAVNNAVFPLHIVSLFTETTGLCFTVTAAVPLVDPVQFASDTEFTV
jgi:hypothetical protein